MFKFEDEPAFQNSDPSDLQNIRERWSEYPNQGILQLQRQQEEEEKEEKDISKQRKVELDKIRVSQKIMRLSLL